MSIAIDRLGLIIAPDTHPAAGDNINGPCCIEVPDWCEPRLGRFYLYFADHVGSYVRMAYADRIEGPWRMQEGGVLDLSMFVDAYDHIASPDIFLDHQNRRARLYFHARSRSKGREQWTFAAASSDGLEFDEAIDRRLAPYYLKVFTHRGYFYGMAKGGNLWRSKDGLSPFEAGGNPFDSRLSDELWHNDPGSIRHVGLDLVGDLLTVYYTRIGDAPERILRNPLNLADADWLNWLAHGEEEVLRPETAYEGAALPIAPSVSGPAYSAANALRDPHILTHMGEKYMFYSVCGEQGIAVCKLRETNEAK